VLVELGATVPTRSLAVTESRLGELEQVVEDWLAREGEALRRAVGVGDGAGVGADAGQVPAEAVAR
jgi:FMN reductase